ncbi:phage tail assembly protein [Verminephrobacter aporrectodeae subsp. tuberculatae]|uniref:Phage tail assembly protein n=1 Tax=Verminephrobacter aporrectodeae subsp. tuberculatae TaxID=1110392 RepID=A0ABT3KQZ3_9BURK|nr:phage tail assembly protein [Verminephrobacter aporrectodeae]MCW5320557.1 phage tail assembly protein [Verminephrobacter aporrectodeae subsp. tuberculatae]
MNTKTTTKATDETIPPVTTEATVTLGTPILRGEQTISSVTLRKPRAGQLRGLSLTEILQLKVDAVTALLSRISTPTLLRHEVDNLEPEDLVALSTEVVAFFLPKDQAGGFQTE